MIKKIKQASCKAWVKLGLFFAIGTLVLLLGSSSQAQEKPWSLPEILDRATAHSPILEASRKDSLSISHQAKQAGRWDNPVLNFSAGTYTIAPDRGTALNVMLMQSVPVFGQKSIARHLGEKEAEIAELDATYLRLNLRHEVVRLSYRLASLQEQYDHLSHRRERLALLTRYLQTRPFAAPAQAVEKNLIENRMREIEEKFTQVVAEREGAWQELNVFLGLPELVIPRVPWSQAPSLPNRDELLASLGSTSPELLRQAQIIEASRLSTAQAGKLSYPDIRVGAGVYNQVVAADRERSYVGALELSLPLWNRGQDGVRAAELRTEAELLRAEQKNRDLQARFSQAWTELTEARKRIDLYPESLVPVLENQMRSAEANWKKGLVPASSLLDLETQVHDQAVKVYQAQTDFIQSLSQILLLSGKDIQASLGK